MSLSLGGAWTPYFADPYTARHHRNRRAPQRSDPRLPTHTHRLSNHNRQRAPGDHHRDQQLTPKTPQPENTNRNPPTPHTTTPPQCCTSNLNTGFTPVWFLRLTSQGVFLAGIPIPRLTEVQQTSIKDRVTELHRIMISLRNETDTKLVRTLINVESLFPSSCARWSSDLDETANFFQRNWFRQKEPIIVGIDAGKTTRPKHTTSALPNRQAIRPVHP